VNLEVRAGGPAIGFQTVTAQEYQDDSILLGMGGTDDAFLCFHKQFEVDGQPNRQAQQAEQWFFRNDSNWLFSFVSVCNALGLEPNIIRQGLRHWNQAGLDIPRGKT
jgi:hypothetical protein